MLVSNEQLHLADKYLENRIDDIYLTMYTHNKIHNQLMEKYYKIVKKESYVYLEIYVYSLPFNGQHIFFVFKNVSRNYFSLIRQNNSST